MIVNIRLSGGPGLDVPTRANNEIVRVITADSIASHGSTLQRDDNSLGSLCVFSVPVVSQIVPLLRMALSFFIFFHFSSVVNKSNADIDTRTCEPDWPSGN